MFQVVQFVEPVTALASFEESFEESLGLPRLAASPAAAAGSASAPFSSTTLANAKMERDLCSVLGSRAMKASLAVGALAVLAAINRKWALQGTLAFLLRSSGLDVRLQREYRHEFEGYGHYNFSDRSWPKIEKRALSSLTADEFKEKYVKGRRAVILTDFMPLQCWSPRTLLSECGEMPVSFERRYSAGLQAIPKWLRKVFLDPRLRRTFNQSTNGVLEAMHRRKTLKEYIETVKKDASVISRAKEITSADSKERNPLYSEDIVDYLFPVMLSAQHVDESCNQLKHEARTALNKLLRFAAER